MKVNYSDRKIFWGNELLVLADITLDEQKKIVPSNIKLVTGLVSVGSMEDQAETTNFPADDVPDHGSKKGATLLQGEMVFIQTDQELREDLMGWVRTPNGLGWSPTGNFKTKLVQYLIKGKKRNPDTGLVEDGWKIMLYPNLTPTAEATFETETDSVDGVDPIQYTFAVQATASDVYTNQGYKVPVIEYEIWGEQAKAFEAKMEEGLFIMLPDTVIEGAKTLVPPAALTAETSAEGAADAEATIPTTLKDSEGADVSVTNSIKDSLGATATNGSLKAGTYTVTFSASGYAPVTQTLTVTDPAA